MIIKLNDEDIQWNAQGQNTLGELIEEFVAKRFFKDEFINTLVVNGTVIPDAEMAPVRMKPLSDITTLQMTTETFRNVSVRALDSMSEYLDGLAGMVEQSADKFRMDDEVEANKYFISCVEGLQTFVGIIDKVKTLNGLDFGKMTHEGTSIGEKESALLGVLNSLFEIQMKKDWVSLADILEYELSPLIIEWKAILQTVADILRKP
ncbi:MAG: hypothetical protein HZA04_07240 [Nitrospinae bacterium]|nr:hypothetical protein [Nitrospinota bacterium]